VFDVALVRRDFLEIFAIWIASVKMDTKKMFVTSQMVNVEIVKWDYMENRVMRIASAKALKMAIFVKSQLANVSIAKMDSKEISAHFRNAVAMKRGA
jgi:predicted Fe-Mo cluster-binding NifX family protein